MRRIVLFSLLLLLSCSPSTLLDSSAVQSIASLRDIETNYRSTLLTENITLEGVVVANDKFGEFYNSIIVEDESGAVRILTDKDDNYIDYPFGCRVTIHCAGLYLINYYGCLTLGAAPTDDYTLDYISSERLGVYLKYIEDCDPPTPLSLSIEQLSLLHTYRYVQLSELSVVGYDDPSQVNFCERDPDTGFTVATTHTLVDAAGVSIELRVNRLCKYADAPLPAGTFSPSVIVDCYAGDYSVTLTNYDR